MFEDIMFKSREIGKEILFSMDMNGFIVSENIGSSSRVSCFSKLNFEFGNIVGHTHLEDIGPSYDDIVNFIFLFITNCIDKHIIVTPNRIYTLELTRDLCNLLEQLKQTIELDKFLTELCKCCKIIHENWKSYVENMACIGIIVKCNIVQNLN